MSKVLILLKNDFKNIIKEKLMLLPALAVLIFIILFGWITRKCVVWIPDYDVKSLFPLVTAGNIVFTPCLYSFVIGFMLIEEKESKVLDAIRVSPLPGGMFLSYRLSFAILISLINGLISLPLINLTYIDYKYLIPIVIIAALETPIYSLIMATWSNNKVEGMAISKGLGVISEAPLISFFINSPVRYIFALFPSFYPVWAFIHAANGNTKSWLLFVCVGLVYHVIINVFLIKQFKRKVYS